VNAPVGPDLPEVVQTPRVELADLTRFGKIEDGILTCTMHGWQFELATGKCLTSDDRKLFTQRLDKDGKPTGEEQQQEWVKPPALKCKHCWYIPPKENKV